MTDYLITERHVLAIEPSEYRLTHKLLGTNFYITTQALSSREPFRWPPPPDCGTRYKLADASGMAAFEDFYALWDADNAFAYRGVPGCHFSWPQLVGGGLASEGAADIPVFTMGNAQPTRWLPTDIDRDIPRLVATQCCDQHTTALIEAAPVPIGVCLKIRVGRAVGIPLCYVNPGETLVRGPLNYGQWLIDGLIWFGPAGPLHPDWPLGLDHSDLMPVRPYQPTQAAIDQWWNTTMAPWRAAHPAP